MHKNSIYIPRQHYNLSYSEVHMKDPYFPDFFALISIPLNTSLGPYLVLFGALVLLWLFGKLLQKFVVNNTASKIIATKSTQQFLKPHKNNHSVTYLQQGFHIIGLSPDNLEELRVLMNKNDKLELALFFARYQPSIKEINDAIDSIQNELSDMWDQIISAEIKSEKLAGYLRSKNHKSKNLNCLSENDFRNIIKHEQKENKIIDQDFIARFGDFLFMENFIMYEHLCQSDTAVYHIPRGNELRRMFDMFVSSGIATSGLSIPLKERLKILAILKYQSIRLTTSFWPYLKMKIPNTNLKLNITVKIFLGLIKKAGTLRRLKKSGRPTMSTLNYCLSNISIKGIVYAKCPLKG